MHARGFEDTRSAYASDDPQGLVGQFRRFCEDGPAYGIVRIVSKDEAWISVVYSDEELAYPIFEIVQDPVAETIP